MPKENCSDFTHKPTLAIVWEKMSSTIELAFPINQSLKSTPKTGSL